MNTMCPQCGAQMSYVDDIIVGPSSSCPDDPDFVSLYRCENCGTEERY